MLHITSFRIDQGMNWYEEISAAEEDALLAVVTYGKCVYWADGDKTILEKGDVFALRPASDCYGKSIPTVFHEKLVIRFRPSDNDWSSLPLFEDQDARQALSPAPFEYGVDRLRAAYKEWNEALPFAALRVQAALLDAIALWARDHQQGKPAPAAVSSAERMKQYVQLNYREKITKEELGAAIGRSPNYTAALFRRTTGQTISEYVHAQRMKTAAYMLTESLLSVSEIAEYLGYRDVSYFQRLFKRATGRTPGYYMQHRPRG